MQKNLIAFLNCFLSLLLTFGSMPMALAQEAPMMPAIQPGMAQDINAANRDVLNRDRGNRDQEIMLRQLIAENDLLTRALCDRQLTVLQLRREIYGIGAADADNTSSACGTGGNLNSLRNVLTEYRDSVIDRDRQQIARNGTAVISGGNAVNTDDVEALIRDVEAMKGQSNSTVAVGGTTDNTVAAIQANLQAQQAILADKVKALDEKKETLDEFKQQVTVVNDEIKKATHSYDIIIWDYNATIKKLKADWAYERDHQHNGVSQLNQALVDQTKDLQAVHDSDQRLIQTLSDQNSRLTADAARFKEQGDQIDTLSKTIAVQQATIDSQKAAAENQKAIVLPPPAPSEDLTKALDAKTAELNQLTQKWQGKDVLLLELKNKLTASDAKLAGINVIITAKDKEIAELKAQLAQAKADLVAAQKDLAASQKELADTQKEMADQKEGLSKTAQDYTQVKGELTQTKEELSQTKEDYSKTKEDLSKAAEDYTKVKEDLSTAQVTIKSNEDALSTIQQKALALKQNLAEQAELLSGKDLVITKLRARLDEAQKSVNAYQTSTEGSAAMMADLQEQVRLLKSEFAARGGDLEKFEQSVVGLRGQIKNLHKKLAYKNKQVVTVNGQIASKEDEINNKDAQISAKDAQINSKDSEIGNKDAQIAKLSTDLKQAISIVDSINQQIAAIDTLSQRVADLGQQLKAKDAALAAANKKADEAMASNGDLKTRLQSVQDLADKQQQQLLRLQEKISVSAGKYVSDDEQIVSMQKRLAAAIAENNSKAQANSNYVEDLKAQLAQKDEQMNTLKNGMKESNASNEQQVIVLQKNLDAAIAEKNSRAQISQNDLQDLKDQLAKKEEQMGALRNDMKERIAESARMSTMLDVYQEKLKAANVNDEGKMEDLLAARKHQSELENQIAELVRTAAIKDEETTKVKQAFYELERRSSDKEQDIKATQLSVTMLQGLIDEKKKEYETKIAALQQEVDRQKADITKLSSIPPVVVIKTVEKKQPAVVPAVQPVPVVPVPNDAADLERQAQLERLKAELKVTQDNLNKITNDYQFKDKEIARLKERSAAKENELKKMLDDVKGSGPQQEIATLVKKLNIAEKRVKELAQEDRVTQLKEALNDSHEQIAALKDKLKQETRLANRAPVVVPAAKPIAVKNTGDDFDLMALHSQLKAMQVKLTESVKRLEEQERVITILKEEAKQKSAAYQEKITFQTKDYKQQMADLRQKLQVAQENLKEFSIGQSPKDLKAALEDARQQVKATEEELAQSKKMVNQLQDDLTAKEKSVTKMSQEMETLRTALAEAKEKLKNAPPQLKTQDDQVQAMKADFQAKAEGYKKDIARLNDDVNAQTKEVARLNALVNQPQPKPKEKEKTIVVIKDNTELIKTLKEKEAQLQKTQNELNAKMSILSKQQKDIDVLRRGFKQQHQDNDRLIVQLNAYKMITTGGVGNEGYLIRDGKNTALMIAEVNHKIEILEQQIITLHVSRQDVQEKYDVMAGELNEARAMLQACIAKVMNAPATPAQQSNQLLQSTESK